MGDFTLTITIEREAVFSFVAEPSNMRLWYAAVDDVITDGPRRIGARFRMTRTLPGGAVANDVEMTEFDPPRRLTLESIEGPTPFRYAYGLDAAAHGTTVTLAGRINGSGLPGPAGRALRDVSKYGRIVPFMLAS
jgi:uncharacterized protein YndB with AHSA1/START domain